MFFVGGVGFVASSPTFLWCWFAVGRFSGQRVAMKRGMPSRLCVLVSLRFNRVLFRARGGIAKTRRREGAKSTPVVGGEATSPCLLVRRWTRGLVPYVFAVPYVFVFSAFLCVLLRPGCGGV